METNKSRKKWGKGDPAVQMPINAPAVREEIFPHHEEYLMLLQEKNRLMKKLRQKSRKCIEMERKEQGFALYVNGANADRDLPPQPTTDRSDRGKNKLPKTAGEVRGNVYLNIGDLQEVGSDHRRREEEKRARTAPSKSRRKGWNVESVDITTSEGDKRKLRAPVAMTGNYEDDFEMDESGDYLSSGSDSEGRGRDSLDSRPSSSGSRPGSARKTSYLKRKAAQIREDEKNDRLTLTMADVRRLRQSLEMNASIRYSLAMDAPNSAVLPPLSPESQYHVSQSQTFPSYHLSPHHRRQDDDSPIEEEDDEDIEEDLSTGTSTGPDSPTSPVVNNILSPMETVVLEFAPLPNKGKEVRNLSAARKKDIDVSLTPRSVPSRPLPSPRGAPSSSVPSNKKPLRPLSANRKSDNHSQDTAEEASAVMRALQEENTRAERYNKDTCRSPRPEVKSSTGDPLPSKSRLSARSSSEKLTPRKSPRPTVLSEDKVTDIVSKVLSMPSKQQRRLVKMLGRLDDNSTSSVQTSLSPTSPTKHPVKATVPVSKMTSKQKSENDALEINMEILSNWGDPERVGLTELQFLDSEGKLVPVRASQVSVHGAHGCRAGLEVLFNGRPKTTKERYMWSCEYEDGLSVEFVIVLNNPSPGKHFSLSAIKVWNFNKSLNELSIGAKHTRIFVGGELVFDGDLEKGCGNQAFDYCKVIDINSGKDNSGHKHSSKGDTSINGHSRGSGSRSSPSPRQSSSREGKHVRSETRTLHHSNNDLRRPSADSDHSHSSPDGEENGVSMPEKGQGRGQPKPKRLAAKLDGHSAAKTDGTAKSTSSSLDKKSPLGPIKKTPDQGPKSSAPTDDRGAGRGASSSGPTPGREDEDDTSMLQKLKDMNIQDSRRKKEVPKWLNADDIQADRFKSPPASRAGYVEERSPSPQPPERPAGKKLSRQGARDDGMKARQGEEDAMIVEDLTPWPHAGVDHLNTVLDSDQAEKAEALDEVSPMMRIQKNRAKWRTSHENLEEEWGSLNLFNKQQRGRLSIDMGADIDEYMSEETGQGKMAAGSDIPDSTPAADQDENFVIPELPYGQELVMNIQTTWGDRHYVGLTGIDVFSSTGEPVVIKQISAKPKDINELAEYHKDPRVVTNLIDGVNRTRDDVHMWLAPFTTGADHKVFMTFEKPCKVAMIRIWNYNKSRIHSYRGAKDIVMTLNKQVVFRGEIARACGGVEGGTEAFGDTILFTMDEDILEEVSKNDDAYDGDMFSDEEEDVPFERPGTADNEDRPFTRAAGLLQKKADSMPRPGTSLVSYAGDIVVYKAKKLELDFRATWGDMHYLGLSGIEVADKDGEPIPLKMSMLSATPRDLHCLPGHERDDRTLDKLIDGSNITLSDEHMWLVPYTPGHSHTVTVTFDQPIMISAIRLWNYNKSPEDTYRGVKLMHVKINGKQVSPDEGYLIRKGPGNCHFDFAQEISLSSAHKPQNSYPQATSGAGVDSSISYEVVQMPCGFIYQLQLFSTWGDQYYVGLNGIEVYDSLFNQIQLTDNNISAFPESCNVLDNIQNDIRTPDKLIDGINDSTDGKHMWLTPILPSIVNRVYIIFDQPTTVSMVKVWNYSKTPGRGVKDFALLVDDLLVYNGSLPAVTSGARGILPNCPGPQPYHTVLFTDNKEILKREKNTIISKQSEDQDIQLLNDKQIVSKYNNPKSATSKPVNQALRPKTSVPLKKR